MLLPHEQGPWNCGYYLGAIALKALKGAKREGLDLPSLQKKMEKLSNRSISLTQTVAATTWLFLLDSVELRESGVIMLCD